MKNKPDLAVLRGSGPQSWCNLERTLRISQNPWNRRSAAKIRAGSERPRPMETSSALHDTPTVLTIATAACLPLRESECRYRRGICNGIQGCHLIEAIGAQLRTPSSNSVQALLGQRAAPAFGQIFGSSVRCPSQHLPRSAMESFHHHASRSQHNHSKESSDSHSARSILYASSGS
jgi:hypothetical protein